MLIEFHNKPSVVVILLDSVEEAQLAAKRFIEGPLGRATPPPFYF